MISRLITVDYYNYSTIPLRVYLQVTATANYRLVCKSRFHDLEKCLDQWEEIVKKNSEVNNSYAVLSYLRMINNLNKLRSNLLYIRTALLKLHLDVDRELVSKLSKAGYFIELTKSGYYESLKAAVNKSENLVTKIQMQENEIAAFGKQQGGKGESFEELMANLVALLGVNVPDDITLARYNEYKKFIKLKYKAKQRPNGQAKALMNT